MSLNQYRELREISLATWPPANDTDWVPSLTNPTAANIPQLEFDTNELTPTNQIVFFCDFLLANGTRLAVTNQTYDAQLIEIANPQVETTVATVQNVAIEGCERLAIPPYQAVQIPTPGPGIYGLRLTNWAGSDPGAAAGAVIRFFMRGL